MKQRKIIQQIKQGGKEREQAISVLYNEYSPKLYGYYMRTGITPEDVQGLVQDVFIQVIRKIHTFRGESKISTWLWSVARNVRLMYFRGKKPPAEEFSDYKVKNDQTTNEDRLQQKSMQECVEKGFKQFALAEADKAEALRLVSWYGWSIKDVADFLDKKLGATREYLSQCRKKLKPFIAHCLEYLS